MGARRPNSKEEMSHSNLAAIEKTNGVHLSQKTAGSLSPLHGIHYPENTFKTSSPTKKLEKKSWLLTQGGKGAAGKDRVVEASK